MSGVEDEVLNISHRFSSALLRNPSVVRYALRECGGADGTYKLLHLVEYLLKLPSVRGSLEEITCHVQLTDNHDSDGSSVVPGEPYGAKMVHFMLSKEKYFMSFQCSYYLLYQCFIPTTLHIIVQRYTIPESLETHILKQFNWRTVNQSLLNYLLIELRKDKDIARFWETLTMMIEEPQLKKVVDNYAVLKRNVNKEVEEISSTYCDTVNFTCLSEAALPAVSFPGAADDSVPMWIYSADSFLRSKRYRQLTLHQSTSEGSPLGQRKPEMTPKMDRLIDKRSSSYHEMADVCLKTVGTEKKLFNTSPGDSAIGLVPHDQRGKVIHDEKPFFLKYSELAKRKPNISAVFKKYSSVLLDNFPENYMASLEIMFQNCPTIVPSKVVEEITTPTSYIAVNERIFDLLLYNILVSKTQECTIDYVIILKKIVKDFNKNAVLIKFDNELTYAIAQDANVTRLHHGDNSARTRYSDFRGGPDHSHQWVDNALYQSTPITPVQKIEEMSDLIFSEPNNLDKLKPKTVAVIKKYYVVLLKNFPKDHMVSLERYSSIHKMSDCSVDQIIAADNPDQANRRLFGYMTYVILPDHDDSLFTFCSNLEIVIGNHKMLNVIEQLRNDLIEAIFEDVSNPSESMSHSVPRVESHQSSSQQALPSRQSSSSSQLQSLSPHHSLSSHHSLVSQQPLLPQQSFDDMPPSLIGEDPDDIIFNLSYELMTSLPEDFKKTVDCLRQHFTDDEVNDILSASDYLTGNRRIITTLMNHAKGKEGFLKLCDILESIENAPHMCAIIKAFKKRFLYGQEYAGVTTNHTPDSIPHSTHRLDNDKSMSGSQTEQQRREKLIAVINKHYSAILKSFPVDFHVEETKMLSHGQRSMSKFNSQITNERMFNKLVNEVVSPDYEKTPVDFCCMLLMLIGDAPAVMELQKDVLELLDRKTAIKAIASFQYTLSYRDSVMKAANLSTDYQDDKKEQEICLSSFDDYYDLLLKVNPRFAKIQFILAFRFEHGDPLTGNLLFQHNEIQMEVLLVNVRSSIGTYGTNCFIMLLEILCNQEPYKEIGFHMLDVYHARGGHQIPSDCYTRTGNPLPIEELTRRLEYHSKQLQAGLQYQPPKPLPEYYIPRPNLLNRIVKAVMDSDSGSIDVDLAFFSLPGYGKSTLVKALCYHDDIMQYFLDGFLWIKFSYATINHYSQLKKIYYHLTAMNFTGDQSLLIDKLKTLVADHLQRLLVIFYDVHIPDDVMLYLEIFRNCKVILLSTKEELCHFIPIKQKIVLDWRNTDTVMSIKLVTAQVNGFENINSELFAQLKGLVEDIFNWPILLHIVHHQLLLYCNKYKLSPSSALQKVLQKLMPTKGSKVNIINSAEQIIEGSLEFLENKDICCLNELLYSGGLEGITPKYLLSHIWKVNEEVANRCIELLHSCGFVQYTEKLQLTETTYSLTPCVEIHSTVYQYLLLKMNKTTLAYDV